MEQTDGVRLFFTNDFVTNSRRIHTASLFARSSLMCCLQECGHLSALKSHRSERSGLDSYLFFVVTAGSGTVTYEGKTEVLTPGDCVFLDCRKPYSQISSQDDLWSLSWVHFTGASMDNIYSKYQSRGGNFAFLAKEPQKYEKLLDEIYQIAKDMSYVVDMELNSKLCVLLEYLMRETIVEDIRTDGQKELQELSDRSEGAKSWELKNIKRYVDQHYTRAISLEDVAEAFFINKQYLSKLFKEQYGISVNNYILQMRVTKAKGLLRFGKGEDGHPMSIEEIGVACGFLDPNYFSRAFKKVEGISPSKYRKSW